MDINEKLIAEVEKHDCVYNMQSKLYKNFYIKEELWEKIGKVVGITADDARKRWKSVRDAYRRYKQKLNQPSGSETVFCKPYKYSESLRFLDDIQTKRTTVCNISEAVEISSESEYSPTPPKKKMKSADIQIQMETMIKAATTSIENIAGKVKSNTTSQLFDSLANKIQEANLTNQQINNIESDICTLVFSKLREYTNL